MRLHCSFVINLLNKIWNTSSVKFTCKIRQHIYMSDPQLSCRCLLQSYGLKKEVVNEDARNGGGSGERRGRVWWLLLSIIIRWWFSILVTASFDKWYCGLDYHGSQLLGHDMTHLYKCPRVKKSLLVQIPDDLSAHVGSLFYVGSLTKWA